MFYINKCFQNTSKETTNALKCYQFGTMDRSSHQRFSMKKGVLRNFAKFTKKHLHRGLFFDKVADLRPAILSKETLAQMFSFKFCEISKKTFFTEHLWTDASIWNSCLEWSYGEKDHQLCLVNSTIFNPSSSILLRSKKMKNKKNKNKSLTQQSKETFKVNTC